MTQLAQMSLMADTLLALPVLGFLWLLSKNRVFERPGPIVFAAAILGGIALQGVAYVFVYDLLRPYFNTDSVGHVVFLVTLAALEEELLKLAALLCVLLYRPVRSKPILFIACSIAVGFGFATAENWEFVRTKDVEDFLLHASPKRLVDHATYTGISAIFLVLGWINTNHRWRYWTAAVLVPTALHSLHNIPHFLSEWDIVTSDITTITAIYNWFVYGLSSAIAIIGFLIVVRPEHHGFGSRSSLIGLGQAVLGILLAFAGIFLAYVTLIAVPAWFISMFFLSPEAQYMTVDKFLDRILADTEHHWAIVEHVFSVAIGIALLVAGRWLLQQAGKHLLPSVSNDGFDAT